MPERGLRTIFRKGSRTYFHSSRFFPKAVREDVSILYGFVRTADDHVDAVPQRADAFNAFAERFRAARGGRPSGDPVVDGFAALERRLEFDPGWADAFLRSMAMDLEKSRYESVEETLAYIHGSAEVIGLMMASLMALPPESHPSAARLGRAMQYINFIRDFAEDRGLGRRYLPLDGADPRIADESYAREHPEDFAAFLRGHLNRYRIWQKEAVAGYAYIPRRYRIPVAAAADMYWWTAERIERNPLSVFDRQIKPSRLRVWLAVLRNALGGC